MERRSVQTADVREVGDIMNSLSAGACLNSLRPGSDALGRRGRDVDSSMPKERMTEDLLAHLLACGTPEAYLAQEAIVDRSLSDYLKDLLKDRGMNRNQLARISCVNPQFVYDIFKGKSKPERDNALMLAFGLRCSLREFQRLLRLAGVAELWPKTRRDAIIIWCIERGYTRVECDDELYRLGERTIFKATGAL